MNIQKGNCKNNSIYNSIKNNNNNNKNLGTNLTKEVKDLSNENYQKLLKEMKEVINK